MTPNDYRAERATHTRAIKKALRPLLWESGYVRGSTLLDRAKNRRLKIWVPKNAKGGFTNQTYKLPKGFVLQEFEGFTEDGVITDAIGGGLATLAYEDLPLEDLFRLARWVELKIPAIQAKLKQK